MKKLFLTITILITFVTSLYSQNVKLYKKEAIYEGSYRAVNDVNIIIEFKPSNFVGVRLSDDRGYMELKADFDINEKVKINNNIFYKFSAVEYTGERALVYIRDDLEVVMIEQGSLLLIYFNSVKTKR